MPAKFLEANTCQDRCGIIKTKERFEGAPIYRCPGCDSRWYETSERTGAGAAATSSQRKSLLDRLKPRD